MRQLAALRVENERLKGNTAELLKLRGEVTGLRREAARIGSLQIVSVDGSAEYPAGVTRIGAIVEDEFYGGGLDKPPGTVQNIRSWYLIQTNGEWKVTGGKYSW